MYSAVIYWLSCPWNERMALLWQWRIGTGKEDLTKSSSKIGSTLSEQTARSGAWDSGHGGKTPGLMSQLQPALPVWPSALRLSPLIWNWWSYKFLWIFLKIVGHNVLLTMLGHIRFRYLLTVPTRQKIHTSNYGNGIEFPWDDLFPSFLSSLLISSLMWTWRPVQMTNI